MNRSAQSCRFLVESCFFAPGYPERYTARIMKPNRCFHWFSDFWLFSEIPRIVYVYLPEQATKPQCDAHGAAGRAAFESNDFRLAR